MNTCLVTNCELFQFDVEVGKLIKNVMETNFDILQIEELNGYIDAQLITLNTHLEKEVFQRVLYVIYQYILKNFLNIVEEEIHVIITIIIIFYLF